MTRRTVRAAGSCGRKDKNRERPQIVIRFDRETFDQIAAIAARSKWSFNGVTRLLVEWGLEDIAEEHDAVEKFEMLGRRA